MEKDNDNCNNFIESGLVKSNNKILEINKDVCNIKRLSEPSFDFNKVDNSVCQIEVVDYNELKKISERDKFDFEKILNSLNDQYYDMVKDPSSIDYLVASFSGVISFVVDTLYVAKFDIKEGYDKAKDIVDQYVIKIADMHSRINKDYTGFRITNVQEAVKYLEDNFHIGSDSLMNKRGGPKYHHIDDFTHLCSPLGLIFSIISQFSGLVFGIGKDSGLTYEMLSKEYIGKTTIEKIYRGTIVWFFHIASDIAGSGSTCSITGGTGLPGPIVSMLNVVASFIPKGEEGNKKVKEFMHKLFDGSYFPNDVKGDFRMELGVLLELGKESISVILNDVIVRSFYFLSRLIKEVKENDIKCLDDIKDLNWKNTMPFKNEVISKMLVVSSGVFTTLDLSHAIAKKDMMYVNVIGVCRFAFSINGLLKETVKEKDIKRLIKTYYILQFNSYRFNEFDKVNLAYYNNISLFNILENVRLICFFNDIENTGNDKEKKYKKLWIEAWKEYTVKYYKIFDVDIEWFSLKKIKKMILDDSLDRTSVNISLINALLKDAYYKIPEVFELKTNLNDKEYKIIHNKYNDKYAINFINDLYKDLFGMDNFATNSYNKFNSYMNRVKGINQNNVIKLSVGVSVAAISSLALIPLAPAIAPLLVGGKFAALHGAALTSASLAYLGGGSLAAGGLGIAGGTCIISGIGGATLGSLSTLSNVAINSLLNFDKSCCDSREISISIFILLEYFLKDKHDFDFVCKYYDNYERIYNNFCLDLYSAKAVLKDKNLSDDDKSKMKLKDIIKRDNKAIELYKNVLKVIREEYNKFIKDV